MDNHPISCYHLGHYFQIEGKQLQEQYKEHISDYNGWEQKDHADEWMLFTKKSPWTWLQACSWPSGDVLPMHTGQQQVFTA